MMRRRLPITLLGVGLAVLSSARADDLTGSSAFLCTAQTVNVCTADGECVSGAPWMWNIPQFIVVDLDAKTLSTTKASGENRSTPILNMQRSEGNLFLQGIEKGRAFSIEIEEETGYLSAAVARGGVVVAVFGVCTPTAGAR